MLRFVCVRQQFVVRGDVGGRLCCHLPLLFDPVVDVTKPYFSLSLTVGKMGWTGEPFRKAQYSWPPRNDQFRSDAYLLFYEASYTFEEINRTEPSPFSKCSLVWRSGKPYAWSLH